MQFAFGAGIMTMVRTDITGDTPVQVGGFQEGSVDFTGTTKTAYGQYQFPLAAARGKSTIKGKMKMCTIQGRLISDLHFGVSLTSGQLMQAVNESNTVAQTGVTASPALAIGSTASGVASGAFGYMIAGSTYSKTAVAAGTALPVGTIPQNLWGIYLFSIVAAGTITVTAGSANSTGYANEAAAIAAMPATPANSCVMGYVTVTNTSSGGFVGGTTLLSATGVTANFYNAQLGFPFSVTNAATFQQDLGLYYADTLLPLTKVTTLSAAGQYVVNSAGVYNLSSSETDLTVLASYAYTYATTGNRIVVANPLMGINPVFATIFRVAYTGPSGQQNFLLKLNACVSEKLTFASKLDDFMIPEFDFEAFADSSNNIFTG